jgi:type IV secretory pathway VirB10-like protein
METDEEREQGEEPDGTFEPEEEQFEAETPDAGLEPEEGERFETTAAEATGFDTPGAGAAFFDRKKVTMVLCAAFALAVSGGFVMNLAKNKKEAGEGAGGGRAATAPPGFLKNQLERARDAPAASGNGSGDAETGELAEAPPGGGPAGPDGLPGVSWNGEEGAARPYETGVPPGADGNAPSPVPPPPGTARQGGGSAPVNTLPTAHYSPLVPPRIEGSLFGGGTGQDVPARAAAGSLDARYPYLAADAGGANAADEYLRQVLAARNAAAPEAQTAQTGDFYSAASGGGLNSGFFLGENALWPGTVIPAVLETAINTDLPGNVIARTTRNMYDSRSGGKLLVPQGSLLIARYNSSVSYAQSRVQIVWDTLIRPDGFYIALEGMNGVDKKGMSGQEAEYHENWFEYAKAAGLITMFSIAGSKMTEEAAKYASGSTASGIAQANSEFVNQTGGNIVSRAMSVQPTLTVENGTPVNIMLNKTVYLPPAEDYPAAKKYTLK